MLSLQQCHTRYQQQARWTQHLRAYLYPRAGLESARRVLDVGCGTAVLLQELQRPGCLVAGLDIEHEPLRFGKQHAPGAMLCQADGAHLPYPDGAFDICLCHFLLLWVADPARIVSEMRRVTCAGGWLLALAEPDYGGRIDYPLELAELGQHQAQALQSQGADPLIGRKLSQLYQQAGLTEVECGVLGGQWPVPMSDWENWESEWMVRRADLSREPGAYSPEKIETLQAIDRQAWQQGHRILYVPTFYAAGRVP